MIAWRFVDAAPANGRRLYRPFAALFVLSAALGGRYWLAWIRDADRRTAVGDESAPD